MAGVLAVLLIFGGGSLFLLSISPVGRAYAERLRGEGAQALPGEELDDIRAQLASMREQLSELAERQDFTERLLAQARDKGALGAPKGT